MFAILIIIALIWVFGAVTRNNERRQREIDYRVDREQEERFYHRHRNYY